MKRLKKSLVILNNLDKGYELAIESVKKHMKHIENLSETLLDKETLDLH